MYFCKDDFKSNLRSICLTFTPESIWWWDWCRLPIVHSDGGWRCFLAPVLVCLSKKILNSEVTGVQWMASESFDQSRSIWLTRSNSVWYFHTVPDTKIPFNASYHLNLTCRVYKWLYPVNLYWVQKTFLFQDFSLSYLASYLFLCLPYCFFMSDYSLHIAGDDGFVHITLCLYCN